MKVRSKLLLSMAGLILFMGCAFFALTYYFTSQMFSRYVSVISRINAEQLAVQLGFYYQSNNRSWTGVDQFLHSVSMRRKMRFGLEQQVTLYDDRKRVIAAAGRVDGGEPLIIPVQSEGIPVGHLEVRTEAPAPLSEMERRVMNSMIKGTLTGVILTSLAAMAAGAWLARVITRPLRSMIRTMQKIRDGDLEARLDVTTRDEFGEVGETFNMMADRLHRTEQARAHLVADVAHELRTPLTIIQGQLELIQQGVKPAEPAALLPIQDEVSRLVRLVQDLHQLSLAEVGRLPLEKKPTDLAELLANLVCVYRAEAEDLGIDLTLDSGDKPVPEVMADRSRLAQVFVNLITNALRYTPVGGRVSIRIDARPSHVVVSIADTGKGIAEQHLPMIFNRFYRADENRARSEGGTGLGLAIAKEFVEAHGGSIRADSREGKGTVFIVEIPALPGKSPA